jgi:hypothetical protein
VSDQQTTIGKRLGNRTAIILAGAIGFAAGGVGLVAATAATRSDDAPATSADVSVTAETTATSDSASPSSTPASVTVLTVDPSVTVITVDDSASSSSTPDSIDDSASSSSTPNSIDDSDDDSDDDSSSSVPSNSTPSSGSTGSSSPSQPLPAPFTKTYSSNGGSITVSWSGTAFTLVSVDAAAGFEAEIKDARADRVRVEFDNGDDDYRIDVRISDDDNSLRVSIG